jgi:hypothetical protein
LGNFERLNILQAWWLHRRTIELSVVRRASFCFLRRARLHALACVDRINTFMAVVSGLASDCGLSRRDVSQCVGPFDQVLLGLSRIQQSAAEGNHPSRSSVPLLNHHVAALGVTAGHETASSSPFVLEGVCMAITAASPVLSSFCSLAPSLISYIDTMRVLPSVVSYLHDRDRRSSIQAAFMGVLVFIVEVLVFPPSFVGGKTN